MILTFVPAGEAEQFFRDPFEAAPDRYTPPPPLTDAFIQNLLATAERYDLEFLPRLAGGA